MTQEFIDNQGDVFRVRECEIDHEGCVVLEHWLTFNAGVRADTEKEDGGIQEPWESIHLSADVAKDVGAAILNIATLTEGR